MRTRARLEFAELLRSEQGIALPMAMLITVIAMGMAAIPIVASVSTQNGDRRDQASDAAMAAADAGANIAIARQTQMASYLSSSKPCVKLNTTKNTLEAVAAESGWCPQETLTSASSPPAPVGTKVVYRVKPAYSASGGENAMTVFASGSKESGTKTISRQISVEATSKPGTSTTNRFLGSEGVVGEEFLTLGGGGTSNIGSVGSNGKITFTGGGHKVCGSIRYGPEYKAPGITAPIGEDTLVPIAERPYRENQQNGICYPPNPPSAKVYAGKVTYPAPEPPADLLTNNSNGRFFSEDGRDLPSWYLSNPINSWNPSTRTLSIDSGVTLTLSGTKPYFLCRLRLEGGATIRTQAPGQPVQIWFDKPENCPSLPSQNLSATGASAKHQLQMAGGSHFTNNGYVPGLYFLGSTSQRTLAKVEMQDFSGLIYGPLTDFESVNGGLQLSGAIVARSVVMNGGGQITSTFNGETYEIPVAGTPTASTPFARTRYVECTSETTLGSGC